MALTLAAESPGGFEFAVLWGIGLERATQIPPVFYQIHLSQFLQVSMQKGTIMLTLWFVVYTALQYLSPVMGTEGEPAVL